VADASACQRRRSGLPGHSNHPLNGLNTRILVAIVAGGTRLSHMGDNKYKQRHRDLGLCVDCSEPVYPDNARCLKHLRKRNAYAAWHYLENIEDYQKRHKIIKANRIKNRCCRECSAPLDPDADAGNLTCCNCIEGIRTERSIHGNLIV
jgi:hypothetical protein